LGRRISSPQGDLVINRSRSCSTSEHYGARNLPAGKGTSHARESGCAEAHSGNLSTDQENGREKAGDVVRAPRLRNWVGSRPPQEPDAARKSRCRVASGPSTEASTPRAGAFCRPESIAGFSVPNRLKDNGARHLAFDTRLTPVAEYRWVQMDGPEM
jgi:hypothetical protein